MRLPPIRAKRVWLLGASTGGLEAVVQFLSQVEVSDEIAFVYAQHIAEEQIKPLLRIIANQTHWPVRLAATGQTIVPGTVTVVSPKFDTRLCKSGWLLRFDSPWQGQYRPSIDRLAVGLALLYRRNCGAIIFTGMGDDGSKGCQTIIDRGGLVWVQKPEGCMASAMPAAVLSASRVDFVGTIAQLAEKIQMETEQMEACSQ
ncbi:MAG: chemotaxis protein CheB [Porticoccaceae bacterium]